MVTKKNWRMLKTNYLILIWIEHWKRMANGNKHSAYNQVGTQKSNVSTIYEADIDILSKLIPIKWFIQRSSSRLWADQRLENDLIISPNENIIQNNRIKNNLKKVLPKWKVFHSTHAESVGINYSLNNIAKKRPSLHFVFPRRAFVP